MSKAPDRLTIEDAALRRRIVIAKQGSLSTVLWNPWIAKSARLGDIADDAGADGYRRMVCVETANAGTDVVTLARARVTALLRRFLSNGFERVLRLSRGRASLR